MTIEIKNRKVLGNLYTERATETNRVLDHWILTGSLGSFGLSFIFLKEIGNDGIWYLIYSWYCFGLSALSVLTTYLIMAEVESKMAEHLHKENKEQDYTAEDLEKDNQAIRIWCWSLGFMRKILNPLNKLGIILFALGIILSMTFATKNVLNTKKEKLNFLKEQGIEQPTTVNNYYY